MLIRRLVNDAMTTTSGHVLTITGESMGDVRMTTTDNYQGEESDIVSTWLSLSHVFLLLLLSFLQDTSSQTIIFTFEIIVMRTHTGSHVSCAIKPKEAGWICQRKEQGVCGFISC